MKFILEGLKPPTQALVVRVQSVNHAALVAMTRGQGTNDDWNTLTVALNTARILASEYKIGLDYHEDILKAQQAHNNCGIRKLRLGTFGYTGPEIQLLNTAMEIVDQQLLVATVAEIEKAQVEVDRRIMNGKIDMCPVKEAKLLEIANV
jgi:hypothetical protein